MVEPTARIRVYELSDNKLARFVLGKANMGLLAAANQRAYRNPLILGAWVAMSCVFIQFMQWWPDLRYGWYSYLQPLPAFASMALPFMFFIDWINRPVFEKLTQDVLHRPDVLDISSYYSRSPSSGFWILEYGDKFVGLIAVDASNDSTSDEPVSTDRKDMFQKGTSSIANIRHFYVEEKFREAKIQNDLLEHALSHTFGSDSSVQRVKIAYSPNAEYIQDCLQQHGFRPLGRPKATDVLGWELLECTLERNDWQGRD